MPRKKPDTLPANRQPRPPFAARYVRVCIGEIYRLICEGDEAAADKAEAEVKEFISVTFRGEAATTICEAIGWVRELAQDFARAERIAETVNSLAGFSQVIDHADHDKSS